MRRCVRVHGMPAVPSACVLWRRHGGARTRYTISSEMREKCEVSLLSTSWKHPGRDETASGSLSQWREQRSSLLAAKEHRSVPLACWGPKQIFHVPPPARDITWRSKAPHINHLCRDSPSTVAGRHRRLDYSSVQELSSAATLRQKNELQLILVLKNVQLTYFMQNAIGSLYFRESFTFTLKSTCKSEGNTYLFSFALK